MSDPKVTIDTKKKVMTIELPIEMDPPASKSGKSLTVASTRGGLRTGTQFKGKPLTINVNAYIPAN